MKKQSVFKGVTSLVLLAIFLFPCVSVLAQDEPATETFDDEALPGWERSEKAIIQDGVLQIEPGNFAVRFGEYAGGSLSVKVKTTAGPVFIRYAMNEQGNFAVIIFDEAIVLEKVVQDQPESLGEYSWSGPSGDWQTIEVRTGDGQHEVLLDGASIISVREAETFQGGGVGFWVDGEASAAFDDLTLAADSRAGGAPPEEAIPAEQVEPTQPVASEAPAAPLSVSDLIAELSSTQANPTQLSTFVINLLLSIVLSYILSRVYVHWGSSLSNRRRFAANFILISVTTTFIILVVRSSVALSLGLVGALSIVRFRAAIKEPEELAYLFFAISIGIGLGDNQRLITVLALAAAILVLGIMRLFRGRQADFNLHVTVASQTPAKIELETIVAALKPHSAQMRLMRFDDSGPAIEASFLVEFRNMQKLQDAKSALRGLSDALEITFMDNKGIW